MMFDSSLLLPQVMNPIGNGEKDMKKALYFVAMRPLCF